MDTEAAKRVLRDQEEEISRKLESERMIDREFFKEANGSLAGPNALVLTGVRRCGKSVASILLARRGEYGYVNFDDPSFLGIGPRDLKTIIEAIYSLKGDVHTFVLDEVQNVQGWELLVARLRETNRVIVTGSSARLLSRELSTALTGRHVDFTVFPFSFREFLEMEGLRPDVHLTKDIAATKNVLRRYLTVGGFPESRIFGQRFLLQIYEDIITKDVERRYGIRYRQTFREIARYAVSNVAKETSFNRLKGAFGLKSVHTAKNYLGYLQEAHLMFFLERYSPKLKMQMMAPRKAYCVDTGIFASVGSSTSEEKGRLMENLVAVELSRRKSYWSPRQAINYWKNHAQEEVDFVVREGPRVKGLVQVCFDPSDGSTKKREVNALLKASVELSCRERLVITWDYEGTELVDGRSVSFVPLWKWLLRGGPHVVEHVARSAGERAE